MIHSHVSLYVYQGKVWRGIGMAGRILQLGNEIAKKDKDKLQEKAQSKLVK